MLITAPHLIEKQSVLLAMRGCVDEAERLIRLGLKEGLVTSEAAAALAQRISAFPPGNLPSDHRIHGIFHDSIIGSLHFTPVTRREHAREAFRQAVRWIEVETSSQCNRRCPYCPTSSADRLKTNDFLDFGIYRQMVSELAEIGYDGVLGFVGNSEFFMHRENRRYVEAAHQACPRALIKLYSNGDYLSPDDIAWAMSAGIRFIHVTLHSAPTKRYDDSDAMRRIFLFQRQIGVQLQLLDFVKGRRLQCITRLGGLTLFVKAQDMAQLGHNWNGLVSCGAQKARVPTDPCSYPIRQFIVSHDADLLQCCMTFKGRTAENTRSGATVCNLADYPSIFEAYTSPGMTAWRLIAFTTKAKHGSCGTCPGFDPHEAEAAPLADYALEQTFMPVS